MTLSHTQALPVRRANHFGNIEIKATIEDLDQLDIGFGDSVTVEFSNGFSYRDIPYYNSFLGPGDKPCLYGMAEAYDYVGIGYPVKGNPWDECGATDKDYAVISLSQKGKYAAELNRFGVEIHPTQGAGMTTAEFANFRPLALGCESNDVFFRCANPLRVDTHCSHQAMSCLEDLKPNLIINLSDRQENIDSYCRKNQESHYAHLWKNNAVIAPLLGVDYTSILYAERVAETLSELVNHPKPYLIHCRYGVDRTGFLCVLLEAIANAPHHEIVRDYMVSYYSVYGIVPKTEKYQAIQDRRFGEIESYLCSLTDKHAKNPGNPGNTGNALREGSLRYLMNGGMQKQTLEKLSLRLSQHHEP